jgi:hypothetical protein
VTFSAVTSLFLVGIYYRTEWHFLATCIHNTATNLDPEDGGSILLRNFGMDLQAYHYLINFRRENLKRHDLGNV